MVQWKDIPGYEGLYQASDAGEIKRLSGSPKAKTSRLLKASVNSRNGYLQVVLCKDGKPRNHRVHRLVAATFLGDDNGLAVNHINGNKSDNRSANLEYVTPSENSQHAWDTGLRERVIGEKHWTRILPDEDVYLIQLASSHVLEEVGGRVGLAKIFGVSKTTIQAIITRKGGYARE